ncbi:MAG TPA: hypothetical protein DCL40_03870 [Coxiellaceae bacterium]|nr:hypothetical protein [Coxiellaceae bacterium]
MPANTETNTLRGPLLENNDNNTECSPCCERIGFAFGLAFLGTFIWYASTHSPQQGVTRRVTEHQNIDPLPLLSISLLGLAAMIASTKTKSIRNYLLAWPFNVQTSKIKEDSTHVEQGLTLTNHQV